MKTRRVAAVLVVCALSIGVSPIATARGRDDLSPIDRFIQKIQRFIGIIVTDDGITPPKP
ncbi:MAG TPA: hypothetical protein VK648_07410 [Gemmatimonadaceae bacterium]|nr:hypothetical protein [Gemmatimonadaceae bacterium]